MKSFTVIAFSDPINAQSSFIVSGVDEESAIYHALEHHRKGLTEKWYLYGYLLSQPITSKVSIESIYTISDTEWAVALKSLDYRAIVKKEILADSPEKALDEFNKLNLDDLWEWYGIPLLNFKIPKVGKYVFETIPAQNTSISYNLSAMKKVGVPLDAQIYVSYNINNILLPAEGKVGFSSEHLFDLMNGSINLSTIPTKAGNQQFYIYYNGGSSNQIYLNSSSINFYQNIQKGTATLTLSSAFNNIKRGELFPITITSNTLEEVTVKIISKHMMTTRLLKTVKIGSNNIELISFSNLINWDMNQEVFITLSGNSNYNDAISNGISITVNP